MNKRDHKILLRDKQNLEARLEESTTPISPSRCSRTPTSTIEIAERTRAIGCGGIGALHKMVCKLGLDRAINKNIELLTFHVPIRNPTTC